MKVLILSHMFPSERYPGSGVFVLAQLRGLREAGVDVSVFSPTPLAPRWLSWCRTVRKYMGIPRRSMVEGIVVERPRIPTLPHQVNPFATMGFLFYLGCRSWFARHMRNQQVDLIHAHAILPDGLAAVLLGQEFHIPTICTIHGSDINIYPHQSKAVYQATAWALRRVDRLIAVSDDLKRKTLAISGPRQIAVARNGADEEAFKAIPRQQARGLLGLPLDRKVVCSIAILRPEKSLEILLEAFARLHRPDIVLYVVGDGPMKSSLISRATALGIQDHCVFAGQQPHAIIPVWLSAADCLVLCSLSEGLPTILPEAMLCRVPVVATPAGGIPEIIRHRETGILVPFSDPPALADALEALFASPHYAANLAQRAYAFARAELTWRANVQVTMAVYEDALLRSREVCQPYSASVV